MKFNITIYTEGQELSIVDECDDDIDVGNYRENLSNILLSTKVNILVANKSSLILRPHKIDMIKIEEVEEPLSFGLDDSDLITELPPKPVAKKRGRKPKVKPKVVGEGLLKNDHSID